MKHRLSNLSKIYRDDICRKMNILPIVLCMFCMGNAYSLMAATPSVSETLQQNRKIKGRVVDVNNEPMIGVSARMILKPVISVTPSSCYKGRLQD